MLTTIGLAVVCLAYAAGAVYVQASFELRSPRLFTLGAAHYGAGAFLFLDVLK